jgi:hypothetical protein
VLRQVQPQSKGRKNRDFQGMAENPTFVITRFEGVITKLQEEVARVIRGRPAGRGAMSRLYGRAVTG